MHDHLATEQRDPLRPKSSRLAETDSEVSRAVADGRPDVLGLDAVLGLQRTAGNGAVVQLLEEERSPVHDVVSSGGRPLEPEVRTDMESRLGHDFSDVRVHDDAAAAESAGAVNAHAYTVGSNIVFQRDQYDPSSVAGQTTLAHELTHVVQQRAGAVDGTDAPGGITVSDPSDRFEREAAANADRVMSAPAPVQSLGASSGAGVVQREAIAPEEDEEAVQGLFVQRAEGEEDEEEVQTSAVQRALAGDTAVQRHEAGEEHED